MVTKKQLKDKFNKHREEIAVLGVTGTFMVVITTVYGVYCHKNHLVAKDVLLAVEADNHRTEIAQQEMFAVQTEYYSRKLAKDQKNQQ